MKLADLFKRSHTVDRPMLPLRVLGDRVLVALPPRDATEVDQGFAVEDLQQTESGLLLAKPVGRFDLETATRGIVMQLGEKPDGIDRADVLALLDELCADRCFSEGTVREGVQAMAPAPFDVQVGDCVLIPPSAGEGLELGGIHYVILRESEIIAVVEPLKEDQHAA